MTKGILQYYNIGQQFCWIY